MKIIRGKPAKGKPPMIVCTGCGARAREAGVAVDDAAIGRGSDAASMMIEEDDMQPLCEACLAALEGADIPTSRERMQ